MWGSTLTEANTLTNFNFGFSTYKSDILLHLSQWQYWWWFWFSLIWVVYFFLIIRLMSKRTFTFNPVLNTSIRGHGKWGDFLVAIIPLSWCGNILVNSNFILRMIEWQNESSLFTIRVQGKQWYWVYKFDASAAQSIFAAPKNIGHNRWFIVTPLESYCADTYYQALNLGTQIEFKGLYYKYLKDDALVQKQLNIDSLQTNGEAYRHVVKIQPFTPYLHTMIDLYNEWYFKSFFIKKHYEKFANVWKIKNNRFIPLASINVPDSFRQLTIATLSVSGKNYQNLEHNFSFYDFDQVDDLSNFAANLAQENSPKPLMFIRGVLNKHNIDMLQTTDAGNDIEFSNLFFFKRFQKIIKILKSIQFYRKKSLTLKEFKREWNTPERVRSTIVPHVNPFPVKIKPIVVKFDKTGARLNLDIRERYKNFKLTVLKLYHPTTIKNSLKKPIFLNLMFKLNNQFVQKIEDNELLWGFRQKKYKRFKKFFFNKGQTYSPKTLEPIKQTQILSRQFKNTLITGFKKEEKVPFLHYHNAIKYNKHRNELVPVNLARRLLRVKRTLVLPAHVNITIVSNSYDVVHSWFIPGLGIKIDCVPGRSTHHTFYIDNIGFYYGQCAEICGRYHHHMPIRLCALPFEHFLVWWQKKGLRRLHRFVSLVPANKQKYLQLHQQTGTVLING